MERYSGYTRYRALGGGRRYGGAHLDMVLERRRDWSGSSLSLPESCSAISTQKIANRDPEFELSAPTAGRGEQGLLGRCGLGTKVG